MPVTWPGAAWSGADAFARACALMFHQMVFGFPDGELMLSIPMPAPRGEGRRVCHFVWFRPVAESRPRRPLHRRKRPPRMASRSRRR